jgi:hypothetical protein
VSYTLLHSTVLLPCSLNLRDTASPQKAVTSGLWEVFSVPFYLLGWAWIWTWVLTNLKNCNLTRSVPAPHWVPLYIRGLPPGWSRLALWRLDSQIPFSKLVFLRQQTCHLCLLPGRTTALYHSSLWGQLLHHIVGLTHSRELWKDQLSGFPLLWRLTFVSPWAQEKERQPALPLG